MTAKEMVSDYLAGLNASLAGYGGMISQCSNSKLRQTLQDIRTQDETRQFNVYKFAKDKNFYTPAQYATQEEITTVKSELQQ